MQGNLSLRERLLVVLAAAVLPLCAAIAWVAEHEDSAAVELEKSQLKFTASALAANEDRAVDAARQMLEAIAAMPELRQVPHGRCQAYFETLRERNSVYANIGLLAPDGRTLCHALGAKGEASSVKDRDYFRRALATRSFVMGEPIVGNVSRARALPFALPVIEDGEIVAIAAASLDLAKAANALNGVEIPAGARLLVADRQGHVLMEQPAQAAKSALRTATDPTLLEAARTRESVTGLGVDAEGETRLFAIASSRPVGEQGFVVRVGVARATVIHSLWGRARDSLIAFLLLLACAMASVWWVGGRIIVKPAKQILGAVRRLELGRLDARVPLVGASRGEFARIGAAFNLMADSLQLRQADLEAELGRSKSAYATLDQVLNSMQQGVVAVTTDGRFLMYNDAASRLFPMKDAPVLPALWPEHFGFFLPDGTTPVTAEDMPLVLAALGHAGNHRLVFVRNALVPEGRLLQCSWQPLQGGAVHGGLVVFTDITELNRLQAGQAAQFAQLAETQRRLIEAQRIGRVGNWELDLLTGRLWWSDEVFVLFGISREGFKESLNDFEERVHPEDRPLLKPARDRALRDGKAMRVDYRIVKPDGSIAWMHEVAETRRSDTGEPVWFGGMVQDVTQRKLQAIENARLLDQVRELNVGLESRIAERTAQLAQQEQLYRKLAEQAPEVIWQTDPRGSAIFLNRAWCDLVGGEAADWLGSKWSERVHPEDREEVRSNWQQARDSLKPYAGTRRILAQDGTYHTMSYRAAPIIDADGRATAWVGIDTDITQLKAIESALLNSNQELEAFSYSVSHDLRAPLAAISGFSRALEGKVAGVADEKAFHYLARIHAGVVKMEQLIEALLQLSRVGRAPIEWGEVDLSALAHEAVEALQMQDAARHVDVSVDEGLVARGDGRLLRIVLQNLLGNAWKFTGQNDGPVIHVGRKDDAFFVRDNGVGFDMAYAGKLFNAFQRLHTESEFPGTGIGLATVRRIVGRHQGRVWVESEPGRGTTFYFSLPETVAPVWVA
ncbi:MAG TPA: PAS domain-containing protein [Ramlibacter sp.]|jgi:PAS domain S-box-containing protein|nr:PAS domain-containing protein [Ramlibacter sp.]